MSMSNDIAIRVENLGKQYRIGGKQERYKRFTETVMDALTAPVRRLRNLGKPAPEEETIWALRDVSFEIERGEAVGIIGRNGAGKSTLLKILSRITEPTTGRVELHGRVSSLLEVGTGFHPELTGRENIYLNGTILGMRRAEIDKKFDEIVEFSGVERFLDTPVKRYSSGMQVRLAFAVAAHLEPEILLVDEVLAVGDAEFQKKCLGKMGEVVHEGRTVLFVSHNMGAIQALCGKCILLERGSVSLNGSVHDTVASYLQQKEVAPSDLSSLGANVFRRVELLNQRGAITDTIPAGEGAIFRIYYQADTPIFDVHVSLSINTMWGVKVASFTTAFSVRRPIPQLSGEGSIDCSIGSLPLVPGRYSVNLALHTMRDAAQTIDHIVGAFTLSISESAYLETTIMAQQDAGILIAKHNWTLDGHVW